MIFSAVAEDTDDSYGDGICVGAAVGILTMSGELQRMERLHPVAKEEGIDARVDGNRARLKLVSDADDADIAALLYDADIAI